MASLWGMKTLFRSTRAGGAAIGSRVTLGEDRERGEKERPAAPDRRKVVSGAKPGRGGEACSSMASRPRAGALNDEAMQNFGWTATADICCRHGLGCPTGNGRGRRNGLGVWLEPRESRRVCPHWRAWSLL